MINILSEMIKKIIDKNFSATLLISFFQYCLMFKKLEKKYNDAFIEYKKNYLEYFFDELNKIINQRGYFDIKKNLIGLLILFLFSNEKLNDDMKNKIKSYILQYKTPIISYIFKTEIIYLLFYEGSFVEDLKKFNLFDEIFSTAVYPGLKDNYYSNETILIFNFLKGKIIQIIERNFIDFYNSLYDESRKEINKIIFNKLNFSDYLYIRHLGDSNTFGKSYEFILVFQLLREKIHSENFLQNLENNFGVYLESDILVEEIKKKLDSNTIEKSNILEIYDLFSIKELDVLASLYQRQFSYYSFGVSPNFNKVDYFYYYKVKNNFYKKIEYLIRIDKPKYILKHIKKEIKVNNKEKILKDKIIIKNSYDKTYNKRLNKYISKKNINRLLLCKRNHY